MLTGKNASDRSYFEHMLKKMVDKKRMFLIL